MKKKLFQFAILYHERIDKGNNKEEINTQVIVSPTTTLANDEKIALLQIAKQIPDMYGDKLSDVEILIRPF